MKKALSSKLLFIFPVLFLASLAGLYFLEQAKKNELPVLATVPEFSLTERTGHSVTDSNLKQKVWIADFVFTRCAGQCPMMTQTMSMLTKQMSQTHFVSFSVDPGYDTPQVLSEYAKSYEASPDQWWFLTGDRDVLNRIATTLHMNKIDDPMMHSVNFVLIDKAGQVRGYYDATDKEKLEKLKRDAKRLL